MHRRMEVEGIRDIVRRRAESDAGAVAILSPSGCCLSYGRLLNAVDASCSELLARGVKPGSRIGIILPDGPEAAVAFLAAASVGAAAPLNPAYRESEFTFYLSDLKVGALIADRDAPGAEWCAAAESLGLPVLAPCIDEQTGEPPAETSSGDDTALLLHTSGTTGRPKIVPLTHRNLLATAARVADTMRLEPQDRCLAVMPLFHIHGLAAALLASLYAGASVVCAPGFRAPEFFAWMQEFDPSWYTAVPTMHQALVARVREYGDVVPKGRLRAIRSSSSALAVSVLEELEAVFGVPVVEAYGMTEAAHQMACNPLPPARRKGGTVGLPDGPEISIRDAEGIEVAMGGTGEICIRGENVFGGYLDRPDANAEAFVDGWFRTGDLGFFDEDGYLTICGRIKEIINRGGEKIAPREIDEVLLVHPEIVQAAAFAVPDERLGEEIAAAVVCRLGSTLREAEVRGWAADRLAPFKVPKRIVFVEEIPKGPTGKLQRVLLASQLGLNAGLDSAREGIALENEAVAASDLEWMRCLWSEVLRRDVAPDGRSFVEEGGDSVTATVLAARICEETGVEIPVWDLLEAGTVSGMAVLLVEALQNPAAEGSA